MLTTYLPFFPECKAVFLMALLSWLAALSLWMCSNNTLGEQPIPPRHTPPPFKTYYLGNNQILQQKTKSEQSQIVGFKARFQIY